MVNVGVHISIAGSLDRAVDRAKDAGCDVFQMFSRNPRGWGFAPLSNDTLSAFTVKIRSSGIIPVVHMPYLPNLASPKHDIYEKSVAALSEYIHLVTKLKLISGGMCKNKKNVRQR